MEDPARAGLVVALRTSTGERAPLPRPRLLAVAVRGPEAPPSTSGGGRDASVPPSRGARGRPGCDREAGAGHGPDLPDPMGLVRLRERRVPIRGRDRG